MGYRTRGRAAWAPLRRALAAVTGVAPDRHPAPAWLAAGRRPAARHQPPRRIREPEQGWWDAQEGEDATALTVAVLGEEETRWDAGPVVSRLAQLAVNDELLVVYGAAARSAPGHHAVVSGLRRHLPRHRVVALHLDRQEPEVRGPAAAALEEYLDDGSLPVVVTPAAAVPDVAAELSSFVHADRVLRVRRTDGGADLHQVWRRATAGVR
jgi:hypothetical protein